MINVDTWLNLSDFSKRIGPFLNHLLSVIFICYCNNTRVFQQPDWPLNVTQGHPRPRGLIETWSDIQLCIHVQ